MLSRVEVWRAGWPTHRLDHLLHHELPDYSCPVGTGIVVLTIWNTAFPPMLVTKGTATGTGISIWWIQRCAFRFPSRIISGVFPVPLIVAHTMTLPWKAMAGCKQQAACLSLLRRQTWVRPSFFNKQNLPRQKRWHFTMIMHDWNGRVQSCLAVIVIHFKNSAWALWNGGLHDVADSESDIRLCLTLVTSFWINVAVTNLRLVAMVSIWRSVRTVVTLGRPLQGRSAPLLVSWYRRARLLMVFWLPPNVNATWIGPPNLEHTKSPTAIQIWQPRYAIVSTLIDSKTFLWSNYASLGSTAFCCWTFLRMALPRQEVYRVIWTTSSYQERRNMTEW